MFNRAIVVGCPGAGKSTFARAPRDQTHLPLYYLDMLWHKPDKTTISREEFDRRLKAIMAKDKWIIDGNYGRTLEPRFQACDTVFLLDLPVTPYKVPQPLSGDHFSFKQLSNILF